MTLPPDRDLALRAGALHLMFNHDFGSILRFMEESFGLSALGYADTSAPDDLSDCFNFKQQPLIFQTINAPLSADHFLHDTTPPSDPDNDYWS